MVDLKQKRIFVAGELRACQAELYCFDDRLSVHGACFTHWLTRPNEPVDLAILGENCREEDLREIKRQGIETLTEAEFLPLVGMLPLNQRLSLLRSILAQGPSPQTWKELCAHFDAHWFEDDLDLSLALTYAEDHLEQWPETLRVLPRAWKPDEELFATDKAQLARVCDPEDTECAGYLIPVWNYMPFAYLAKPKTWHFLCKHDAASGQTLVFSQGEPLQLLDREQRVIAQTSFDIPKPGEMQEGYRFGFSGCGQYVWLLAYGPDGSSWIYLLHRSDLTIRDQTPLRQPDMWEGRADLGWDQPFCVSPDGERLALCTDVEYSAGICGLFWQKEGEIKVVTITPSDGEVADIVGFSPGSDRFLLVGYYHFMYIWAIPEGELLVRDWSWGEDKETGDLIGSFSFESASNFYYGEELLLFPIEDGDGYAWGISVHDPITAELIGRVQLPQLGTQSQCVPINIVSERLCVCPNTRKARYLPALKVLRRKSS